MKVRFRELFWPLPQSFFLTCGLALTSLAVLSGRAHAVHREVFLLGGQSNMVGTGTNISVSPWRDPLPEVRLYYGYSNSGSLLPDHTWVDLQPGSGGQFGPEVSFGHSIHATDPDTHYALIKHARGGSDVYEDWNPDLSDNVYSDFRSTIASALQALTEQGDTFEIVGMLWTQGIRDGKEGRSAEQYQHDLEYLIADVRSRFGTHLPVFVSRLSIAMTGASIPADGYSIPSCRIGRDTPECPPDPAMPGYGLNGIRLGQEMVATSDPLVYLIDTDSFESDNTHFHSAGQLSLGEAFAVAYLQSRSVPEPPVPLMCGTLMMASLIWRKKPRSRRSSIQFNPERRDQSNKSKYW